MLKFLFPSPCKTCVKRVVKGGWGGGWVLIPFPRKLFFSNPCSNPTIPACAAQIEIPFPFLYRFFIMNPSPSAQNPISQPLKKANPSSNFTPSPPSGKHFANRWTAVCPWCENSKKRGKTERGMACPWENSKIKFGKIHQVDWIAFLSSPSSSRCKSAIHFNLFDCFFIRLAS